MSINEATTRNIYPGLIMLALVFASFFDSGAGAAETTAPAPAALHLELSEQMHDAAREAIEASTEKVKETLSETARPSISLRLVDAADEAKSRL